MKGRWCAFVLFLKRGPRFFENGNDLVCDQEWPRHVTKKRGPFIYLFNFFKTYCLIVLYDSHDDDHTERSDSSIISGTVEVCTLICMIDNRCSYRKINK